MPEKTICNYINDNLCGRDKDVALRFVSFLLEKQLEFTKDNGYWKDKIYYLIKHKGKCVCFIAIKDPDEPENLWTVWSDDISSEFLCGAEIDIEAKQSAYNHVDTCGGCGSCGGGRRKNIFGKVFTNVCGCTFRADNPNEDDLDWLKKVIEIRINEINCTAK